MTEFLITVDIMLPLLLMLAVGWLVRRIGLLNDQTTSQLNKLVFKLLLPILLFNNIRSLDMSQLPSLEFALTITLGVLLIFGLAWLLMPRFVKDPRKRGVMIQALFRSNFAILGIPLMEALAGEAGVIAVSLASLIVVPLNNVLAVVALASPGEERAKPTVLLRNIVTNPLIIGCALGALYQALNITFPVAIDSVCKQLGSICSPLSLVVLGASLRWQGVKDNRVYLMWTVLLRQILIPFAMLTVCVLMGFHHAELGVLLVLYGAPCAVSCYPMADAMGADGTLAASQVVLTTVFSMGTLFVLIYIGKLLGVV